MTHSHETWQDERQREPRTIVDAFRAERDEADQERKDEDYLDTARGVWGPTE
jgi:hypothetical protein